MANVHLAPGSAGAAVRLTQLQMIMEAAPTDDLLILGDTNTRTAEEVALRAIGLDAPRPPRPTWDGRQNPFNGPSGAFIAFFTRALAAGSVTIVDQTIRPGRITVDDRSFHLSDHHALEVTIEHGDGGH